MRIVTYYAVWTALCALVGGLIVAGAHTAAVAMTTGADQAVDILGGAATVAAIAVGQGVVAVLTGAALHALGRTLRATVLLGLAIGFFDLVMYLIQWLVPASELGWAPDLAILGGVVVVVTLAGSVTASAA